MSKISNALYKAEAERTAAQQGNGGRTLSGYLQAIKQELKEELRWVEQTLVQRGLKPSPEIPQGPSATAAVPPPPPAATPAVQPVDSATMWEQAVARLTHHLQVCTQEEIQQAAEQTRLQGQLTELDHRAAQLEQDRVAIRQRAEQTAKSVASWQASKAAVDRQLKTMRLCHALLREVLAAEGDFHEQVSTAVASLASHPASIPDALSDTQHAADLLQQYVDQFRVRLARVAALAGREPAPPQTRGISHE